MAHSLYQSISLISSSISRAVHRASVPIHAAASINQNTRFWYSMCQSVPAPKTISVVQPSVCLAQRLLWADPVVSLRVRVEFIPCTSVQFRDFRKSPHACMQQQQQKKLQRRDPVLDDTSEHRKKKTTSQWEFSAVSSNPTVRHKDSIPSLCWPLSTSVLSLHMPTSCTQSWCHSFLLAFLWTWSNFVKRKKKSPSCWNNDAAKQRGLESLILSQFLNCLTLVFSLFLWVTKSGCNVANSRPNQVLNQTQYEEVK